MENLENILIFHITVKCYIHNRQCKLILNEIENKRREFFKVNYIFTNYKNNENIIEDFIDYAYKTPEENNLLVIIYFIQKKMEEKDFMEKLEKNCGVYLDVDKFIKEMKQKINEIKNYKQLFEYIGSEFGKNENEIELIKKAYEKIESKRYKKNEESKRENDREKGLDRIRGRGRGRGIGRGNERGGRENRRGRGRGRGRGR